jgi:protein SCO1/2
MKGSILLALTLFILATGPLRAQDSEALLKQIGIDQKLNAQVPVELEFRDEVGRPVRLQDCIAGKPTILVLAYYRCPMLCTQVLNGLVQSLRGMPFDVGDQFNVITVSFDAREQPELAAAKKSSYVEEYGRAGADKGWHFLTGGQAAIDRLTQSVGFRYAYDKNKDQFAHASALLILTPQGKVSRYFFGIRFNPLDLKLGLVEASQKKIGSVVDALLLKCFGYDPNQGRYTLLVHNLLTAGAAVTVLVLIIGFGLAWRREWRNRGQASGRGVSLESATAGEEA